MDSGIFTALIDVLNEDVSKKDVRTVEDLVIKDIEANEELGPKELPTNLNALIAPYVKGASPDVVMRIIRYILKHSPKRRKK